MTLPVQMDSTWGVPTPEHIAFRFRLAGPMVRLLAWLVDVVLRVVAAVIILLLIAATGLDAAWGIFFLCWFLLDWLLGALLEWRWNGQTPGKRLFGIKVVGADGLPASAGACFLRNVLRFADALPTPATGLSAMLLSGSFRRLGDLAAGTLVVHEDRGSPAPGNPVAEKEVVALAESLPPEVVQAVDGEAARAIAAFVARRAQFHPGRREEMAEPLAQALRSRFEFGKGGHDRLVCALHRRLFAGQEGVRNEPQAAGSRAHAYLERRRPAWNRFEALIASRFRTGEALAALRLSGGHRAACADLALADAYHLPARTVDYLHRLVARAHQRLYRRVGFDWAWIRDQVLWRVPARLYGDACLRWAALAFFGVGLLAALWAVSRPEAAADLLGPSTIDDLRRMYAEAPRDREADEAAGTAGFYVWNNVGISLACFASGIFLGVGSLVLLAANGVFLGLVFGWMTAQDELRPHFFEFVVAHGPFELGGICIAGAAGMRLGLGWVAPGGLPRLAGLRRGAADAVPVMAVAAVLIALAAPIEAFVSPSALPLWGKQGVALLAALLLLVWLALLGARGRRLAFREPAWT